MKTLFKTLYNQLENRGAWMNEPGVLIHTDGTGLVQICAPMEGGWLLSGIQPSYYGQFPDTSSFNACFPKNPAGNPAIGREDLALLFRLGYFGVYCRAKAGSLLFRNEARGQFFLFVEEERYYPLPKQLETAAEYRAFTKAFFACPA